MINPNLDWSALSSDANSSTTRNPTFPTTQWDRKQCTYLTVTQLLRFPIKDRTGLRTDAARAKYPKRTRMPLHKILHIKVV